MGGEEGPKLSVMNGIKRKVGSVGKGCLSSRGF